MKIENISIICANTTRTKAYLQIMLKNNIFINKCYILTSDLEKLIERNKISIIRKKNKKYFVGKGKKSCGTEYFWQWKKEIM